MTTLNLIARLAFALNRRDSDTVARALIALEQHITPDEIADLLTALDGGGPPVEPPPAAPQLVRAA